MPQKGSRKPNEEILEKGNANVVQKMYKILQGASSVDQFISVSTKEVDAFLREGRVDDHIIKEAKEALLPKNLSDIYTQYHKKPKGVLAKIGDVCSKILEFCHLKSKDTKVKTALKDMQKKIIKGTQENKSYQSMIIKSRSNSKHSSAQRG